MQSNDKKNIVLYNEKKNCCGCGACLNICPKNAISMKKDSCGFLYPHIDTSACIGCGKCKKVCAFQNTKVSNKPISTFAAVAKDSEQTKRSASGGIFAAIAANYLKNDGIVFGAAFDSSWNVKHIPVSTLNELTKLQGSKYTQSNTGTTFKLVKQALKENKKVLYSGTPCQIAGLYGYLGKDYDNLLTIDLICHGVPSNKMFREYIQLMERKEGGKVVCFTFRDKSIGWGINGSVTFEKNKKQHKKKLWQSASSYFYYFLKGWIYRDSCYTCKYTCSHRPADITIGDYWGIEKAHPEYLGKNGWDASKGISVVIANTQKGLDALNGNKRFIEMKASDFEKASAGNAQLRMPSKSGNRKEILDIYEKGNWSALDARYNNMIGWRKYSSCIKAHIPKEIRKMLKKARKK